MRHANHMSTVEARRIAAELFERHGLQGWRFTLDSARRRAGVCKYRERVVSLSYELLLQRPYEDTLNTITHEVAHAIVGHAAGHGPVWRRKHIELGGNGDRCHTHVDQTAPYIGTCGHGNTFARYRKPKYGWDSLQCRGHGRSTPITWVRRDGRKAA